MLVCFDLDDTLLDHQGAERAAALQFAAAFADRVSVIGKAFVTLWREATERHFQTFLQGKCSFQDQRRRRLYDLTEKHLSDDEADRLIDAYLNAYEANW